MNEYGIERLIDWATPSVHFKKEKKSFITIVPGLMAGILFPMAKIEIIGIADLITTTKLKWTILRFMDPNTHRLLGKLK